MSYSVWKAHILSSLLEAELQVEEVNLERDTMAVILKMGFKAVFETIFTWH